MAKFKKKGPHYYDELGPKRVLHILYVNEDMTLIQRTEYKIATMNCISGEHLVNILPEIPVDCEDITQEEFGKVLKTVLTDMGLIESFEELCK